MKLFAALLGVLIVVGTALVLWPRLSPSARLQGQGHVPDSAGSAGGPTPNGPIAAPMTREEQTREELSTKRIPYYRLLRERFADRILRFAVTDAYDTIDMVVAQDDTETLSDLVQNAVAPEAARYGFRRVRFYRSNPATAAEPVTLVAEASDDGTGRWITFRK